MSTEENTTEGGRDGGLPHWALLCGTVLLGLALRTILMAGRGQVIDFDENFYLILAKNLFSGRGYLLNELPQTVFQPMYPIAVGAVHWLIRDFVWAGRAVSILMGGLTCLPFYFLLRELKGRDFALQGALMVALFPPLQDFILRSLSYRDFLYTGAEPLSLFLTLWGVALMTLSIRRGRKLLALPAGAAFGLSYLTRVEGIAYGLTYALLGVALGVLMDRRSLRHRIACAGLCLVAMLAVAFPQFLRIHQYTGEWTLIGKLGVTSVRYGGSDKIFDDNDWSAILEDTFALSPDNCHLESNCWGTTEYHRQRHVAGEVKWKWRPNPRRILGNSRRALESLFWNLCPLYLCPLLVTGAALTIRNAFRGWREFEDEMLILALAAPSMALVLGYRIYPRYMLGLCFLAIYACVVVVKAVVVRIGADGERPARLLVGGICVLLGVQALWPVFFPNAYAMAYLRHAVELGQVAQTLRETTGEGTAVMSVHPQAPFRADRRWLTMPVADSKRVFEYALHVNADAILFEPNHPVVNYKYPFSDAGFRWVLFDMRPLKESGVGLDKGVFEPSREIVSSGGPKPVKLFLEVKAKPAPPPKKPR